MKLSSQLTRVGLLSFFLVNPFLIHAQQSFAFSVQTELPLELEEDELILEAYKVQETTLITLPWGGTDRLVLTENEAGKKVLKLSEAEEGEPEAENSRSISINFLAMDLGSTQYINSTTEGTDANFSDLDIPAFRLGSHVALHFFPTKIKLAQSGVLTLKTAVTIDWTQYYFKEDIRLQPEVNTLTWERPGISYDKNKLLSRYVQLPILLHVKPKPEGDYSFSVGGYVGVLWGGKTKQVSNEEGRNKIRDTFNLNQDRYGLTARMNLPWLNLYANFNLNQIFEKEEDSGIQAQAFTVGVSLMEF